MPQHPWKLTDDELAARVAHCSPPQTEALRWAYAHCADHEITLDQFCAESGASRSTLSKILAGSYRDPRDPSRALDIPEVTLAAITDYREGIAAKMPSSISFVATETARRAWFNCDLALSSRSPIYVRGASHIGKTTAWEKYRDSHPDRVHLITVTAGMGTKGLAVAVAEEMGVSASGAVSEITKRLKRACRRDRLLIFDDFHVLTLSSSDRVFRACMELIRALYDADQCGMILSTTELAYSRIAKDHGDMLIQLNRRGVPPAHLGHAPSQKDVRTIIEAHGLRWPAKSLMAGGGCPWKIIHNLAAQAGLKAILERLRYALLLAGKDGSPVTWAHYVRADSLLFTNSQAPESDWV